MTFGAAPDGGDDAIGSCPNEAFCCFVALGNEAFDGGLQLDDGAEHTAFEPSLGHPGENPSTALSQEQDVGVKWNCQRGCRSSQAITFGCL